MFIQTEATPNPQTMKFLPGVVVLARGSADYPDSSGPVDSPLARRLFAIDGVGAVFLGEDFITITKRDAEWHHLKPEVLGAIMQHFTSGEPMLDGARTTEDALEDVAEGDRETVAHIVELIDTRVRPAVAQDGGDIVFRGFKSGIVYLQMRGSCSGCPSSVMTLKNGIENMLRHFVPEVQEVRQI
ncbi:MAG: NifU family protein [Alphaproteobacteria bacterium]|nr:NifU family protein [Alphaproteobacteria bacterium]